MSAPAKNQNARKDESEVASSFLYIRATKAEKARWVKAASKQKTKLSRWVRSALNDEAAKK